MDSGQADEPGNDVKVILSPFYHYLINYPKPSQIGVFVRAFSKGRVLFLDATMWDQWSGASRSRAALDFRYASKGAL